MLALGAVIAIGAIWIVVYLAAAMWPAPTPETPDSPAWQSARATTAELVADKRFSDVDVLPAEGNRTRIEVVGAVYSRQDYDALKARLRELLPSGDYDVTVEVMRR